MSADGQLTGGTLADLSERIRRKDVSATEVVQAFIKRTDALEPALGAYITRMSDSALADARAADVDQAIYRLMETGAIEDRGAGNRSAFHATPKPPISMCPEPGHMELDNAANSGKEAA